MGVKLTTTAGSKLLAFNIQAGPADMCTIWHITCDEQVEAQGLTWRHTKYDKRTGGGDTLMNPLHRESAG